MKKTMQKTAAIVTALAVVVCLGAFTPGWTQRQEAAHQIAELARSIGLDEGHPIIQEAAAIWWAEAETGAASAVEESSTTGAATEEVIIPEAPLYDEEELNILAKLIWKEAGGCPWDHMCTVGCVVLNRVADSRFPSTIYDVVAQQGQYSGNYVSDFDGIPAECYEAARACLEGEYTIPHDVVWQANFPQGNGIWWESYVDTGWWRSTTYFCY